MGKFRIKIEELANKHFKMHYKFGDKNVIRKIDKILLELRDNPYKGIGNPEQLKYSFSGLWSRRLNQKHRLIYKVDDETVTVLIISAMGHYNDK